MTFAQAYYTSCETGLSGFAGFQFNAATPGLAPQVLREVEALTSYEPPKSLGHHPGPDEIAACPVNLVYQSEPTTILANVVYVGRDASGRLGNYFAHALISADGPDSFERVLPIEFWGSTLWARDPVADRDLPHVPGLPEPSGFPGLPGRSQLPGLPGQPGLRPPARPQPVLDRAGVDRFLAEPQRRDQLAALITAAEAAVLRRGRSIIVLEPDNGAAALWVAAVSFLLPPAVARRMSFATYRHQPEYSDAHLIVTRPDAGFELGDVTTAGYVVLDVPSGRISDVTPDPAAALLVRAGAVRAAGLWARAADLWDRAASPDATLAEGYPALIAAALIDATALTGEDLDVLGTWLDADPARVAAGRRGDLLTAFLDHPDRHPHHLRALAGLATLEDDPALALRVEEAAVLAELAGLTGLTGPAGAGSSAVDGPGTAVTTGVPLLSAKGRAFAGERCAELIEAAPDEVAVPLFGWSQERELELPADLHRRMTGLTEQDRANREPSPPQAAGPAEDPVAAFLHRRMQGLDRRLRRALGRPDDRPPEQEP